MKQEVTDYIKGRIATSEAIITGDIETNIKLIFDNGTIVTGKSIRPIDGFFQEEAEKAACEDAISTLYDGVDFILSKK